MMTEKNDWGSRPEDLDGCPFCKEIGYENEYSIKILDLKASSWRLCRDQGNLGACLLIFTLRHSETLDDLTIEEYLTYCCDLHLASRCVKNVFQPDHLNYALLGNVVPHMHWHLIPRYKSESRWGRPIWTTNRADMRRFFPEPEAYVKMCNDLRAEALRLTGGKA
jgi:diadenosine tetraphosphate (Ap4A) HIT family hydrolase